MGYDDNTPLAGVTGGGLPAQIWHEVMAKVEDGMPPKDLPMIVPQARTKPVPDQPASDQPTPDQPVAQAPAAPAKPAQQTDSITSVLQGILNGGN